MNTLHDIHLSCWSWFTFCWTVVSNPCNSLDWFGIVASPALAGVATVFGLLSAGFTVLSKGLERKVMKHGKIYTLALAKQNSIAELVSKSPHRQKNQRF